MNLKILEFILIKIKIQLKKIILYDKNGGSFSYSITKFLTDTKIDDKSFLFNKEEYPELEIIDLR